MNSQPLWNEALEQQARTLIRMALDEDLSGNGDITSLATIAADAWGGVRIVSREQGVLCGTPLIKLVHQELHSRSAAAGDPSSARVSVNVRLEEGSVVHPGETVAVVEGNVRELLTAERTILNFLSHLSGIASETARYVELVQGTRAAVLDTRKTLPGYRLLQKYAVACGGGKNHRIGLYDGILVKDNHIAANPNGSLGQLVSAIRQHPAAAAATAPLEIEVDSLVQLEDVLTAAPDIVLLDNMAPPVLKEAVALRDRLSPSTQLEASGGINRQTISAVAHTGVDRISVGALTHSVRVHDLGYDWKD